MKRIMGIAFIIVGAVCLTIGIVCLTQPTHSVAASSGNSSASNNCESEVHNGITHDGSSNSQSGHAVSSTDKSQQERYATESPKTHSEEIGQAFENYIVNLLADSRFKLLDRTQDIKSTAGVYAESCMNPDLHVEQKFSSRPIDYFIECKYRSRWFEGKVQFEDYQVKRYKEFQRKQHRKVLFALGVGGTPAAPQELMIIPLDQLVNGAVLESDHLQYRISSTSDDLYIYVESYFKQVFATKKK
jgi:hypothetical protein